MKKLNKKKILFTATTPFAVNAFLLMPVAELSKFYEIILCTNIYKYKLVKEINLYAKVINIPFVRAISPLNDLISLLKLYYILIKYKPDATHSITPKAGLLTAIAAFTAQVPIRTHTYTGQTWILESGVLKRVLKQADKIIGILTTQTFADSKSQSEMLIDEGVVKRDKIKVFSEGSITGVNLEIFHPDLDKKKEVRRKLGASESAAVLLFVGRIVKDKGVDDLIAAYNLLDADEEIKNIELIIVGPDEEGITKKLKKKAENNRMKIHWIGPTHQPENYMAACDLLILPSLREGFGSVIIEAAACGKPAIAYRIIGVVDAIVDGITGILIESRDIIKLSETIKQLINEKRLLERLGNQALSRAIGSFDSKKILLQWKAYYQDVFNK